MNKDQALKFYYEKFDEPASLIREFVYVETGESIFIINDNYVVRVIVPEVANFLMRNQNYKARVSGRKITKTQFNEILTSKYHSWKQVNTWVNC